MSKTIERGPDERVDWLASTPFFLMHLLPLAAFYTGVPWFAWVIMAVLYYTRRWFVTAGFHRYLSHRSYNTGRVMQFLLALGGTAASQKGPIWWAAHHRHHHKHSDDEEDIHSPKRGFWWSHMGWIVCTKYNPTRIELVPDLMKYPELRWLNKYWMAPPAALAALVFVVGYLLTGALLSALGVVLIGFCLSTVLLWHTTFTVNSLAHVFGSRRYATTDTSRNNWLIAWLTGGEGWHNNHHHYQGAARQGFKWWEIDTTYYGLWVLSKLKLVSNLRQPPERVLNSRLIKQGTPDFGTFDEYWAKAVRALQTTGEMATEQKQKLQELCVATKARAEELARSADKTPKPAA